MTFNAEFTGKPRRPPEALDLHLTGRLQRKSIFLNAKSIIFRTKSTDFSTKSIVCRVASPVV